MAGPYYVSLAGNDTTANGLGPDASDLTNKPFRTIGKLIAASGALASGETAYIGPGVYRETVTVGITSPTAETKIIGDPLNTKGFKDGSGNLIAPAPVRWTAWATDDKTAPGANILLQLAGRDFLTFENIFLLGSTGAVALVASSTTGAATNITFRRCCLFVPPGSTSGHCLNITNTGSPANTTLSWLIDSCICVASNGRVMTITPTSSASADYDLDIVFRNSILLGGVSALIQTTKSGANSFVAGGIDVQNCFLQATAILVQTSGGSSTSIPCTVYNSVLVSGTAALSALTGSNANEIVEDYNIFCAASPRSNVSAGGASVVSYAPLINLGQRELWGFLPKPPFSPTFDSPLLGFGSDGSVSLTEDMLGRARPSGPGITWANALKAVGALEYHDFARQETSVVDASGSGWKLTGPGDQELLAAVDATSTSISIKCRYDTNHGTGSKPQIELVANAEIGVSAETITATVGVDTWETLTLTSFTPTAKGVVKIRLKSRAAAGNGIAYFDTASVS